MTITFFFLLLLPFSSLSLFFLLFSLGGVIFDLVGHAKMAFWPSFCQKAPIFTIPVFKNPGIYFQRTLLMLQSMPFGIRKRRLEDFGSLAVQLWPISTWIFEKGINAKIAVRRQFFVVQSSHYKNYECAHCLFFFFSFLSLRFLYFYFHVRSVA